MIKDLRYLLLISAVIFAYGCLTLFQSYTLGEPLYLIWTIISYTSVYGLLLKKQWSKYIVYIFLFLLVGGWLWFTLYVASNESPYKRKFIVGLLFLGAILVTLSLATSIYVHRYFKSNSNKSSQQDAQKTRASA
jgi:thiol:disulfide interchange protein